jgi:hypothetical protein
MKTDNQSNITGWLIAILISLLVAGWGLMISKSVRDNRRTWDYGVLQDTPSESIYSTTSPPKAAPPPKQVQTLPEAVPWKGTSTDVGGKKP